MPKVLVVVDFTIKYNSDIAIGGPHGLFSALLINDRKPTVTQVHSRRFIGPESLFIRAPSAHHVIHSFQVRKRAATDETTNSAHSVRPYERLKISLTA